MKKEEIEKKSPYKLKGYRHDKNLSLKEFIVLFLTKLNQKHITLYLNNKKQCNIKKHRSLGDIFLICKNYYPNTTINEVKKCLLSLGEKLVGHYCNTIKKRIYEHSDLKKGWIQCSIGNKDEFGDKITYNN